MSWLPEWLWPSRLLLRNSDKTVTDAIAKSNANRSKSECEMDRTDAELQIKVSDMKQQQKSLETKAAQARVDHHHAVSVAQQTIQISRRIQRKGGRS